MFFAPCHHKTEKDHDFGRGYLLNTLSQTESMIVLEILIRTDFDVLDEYQ